MNRISCPPIQPNFVPYNSTSTQTPQSAMTTREESLATLKLVPPTEKHPISGFLQQTLSASHGYTLATYLWLPETCHIKGVVFLLHGILGHTSFEWLAPDENNYRTLLKGSVVEKLLQLDLAVVGHDHPGHGRSTGLHGYVDSHDYLRDCAIDVVEHYMDRDEFRGKKTFLLGMSMGGSVSIRICAKRPDLFDCVALLSPAVRPPDDMFGAWGHFLVAIRHVLGALVPKLPVLKLPPSPDPTIRDAVEKDGLLHRGALRVQMGMEFLRVYKEIDDTADEIKFRSVIIFLGGKDVVVSPHGIKQFVDRIQSDDKQMHIHDDMGHEIFREEGCEKAIEKYISWMKEHIDC